MQINVGIPVYERISLPNLVYWGIKLVSLDRPEKNVVTLIVKSIKYSDWYGLDNVQKHGNNEHTGTHKHTAKGEKENLIWNCINAKTAGYIFETNFITIIVVFSCVYARARHSKVVW